MANLPATILIVASTLTAAACTAEARPNRHRARPVAARPLLRATPAANVAVAQPLVTAAARPVCGNIATKGQAMRECKDAIGTSIQTEAAAGQWKTVGRTCTQGRVEVSLDGTGRAQVLTDPNTRRARRDVVEAGATSPEPLVAACRRGLP